jgi:5,10-methylene-tetrahydrofolate dehydrogenase/methenyl tetrahydrofolate cyclohydrolase
MLDRLLVTIEGANTLILGSSSRHGLEISLIFSKLHATVTVANDMTAHESMLRLISSSDIIVLSDEAAITRIHPYLKHLRAESVVVDATIDQESTVDDKRYIYDFYKPVNIVQVSSTHNIATAR